MRWLLYFMSIISLPFLSGCLSMDTQEHTVTEEKVDIKLQTLMEKMKLATDPNGVCNKASSYILKQERITEGDKSGNSYVVSSLFQKEPYFSKTIVYKNGTPITIRLFDGTNAWNINPKTGVSEKLTGPQMDMIRGLGKIGNPSYSYTDIFPRVTVKEILAGTVEYYKLTCYSDNPDLSPMTVYVDKNNFMTKKVSFKLMRNGKPLVDYTSYINKYKLYHGVMMPEITTVLANGIKYQYKIVAFKLDVKFPQNTFKLPVPWYNRKSEREKMLEEKKK